jgi:hypothetical protein
VCSITCRCAASPLVSRLFERVFPTEIAEKLGINRRSIYRWVSSGQLDRGLDGGAFGQMRSVVVRDLRREDGRLTRNTESLRFAHHWSLRTRFWHPYNLRPKARSSD